eukprot:scaffold84093_cov45-Attheya_sp.AAC.3
MAKKALEILERGLKKVNKEYKLTPPAKLNFSETGNFAFGMSEHIDLGRISGMTDPITTGIDGMTFFVCLTRSGARVARRKGHQGRVGSNHTDPEGRRHSVVPGKIRSCPFLFWYLSDLSRVINVQAQDGHHRKSTV